MYECRHGMHASMYACMHVVIYKLPVVGRERERDTHKHAYIHLCKVCACMRERGGSFNPGPEPYDLAGSSMI